MATTTSTPAAPVSLRGKRGLNWLADHGLKWLTYLAALIAVIAIVEIAYQVIDGARPAIDKFGLGFLTGTTWNPVTNVFGAGTFIYGTIVTSAIALVVATPLAIAIGLYLSELAPKGVRGVIGSLVELLAAIPSVVLGLWGILVVGPFLRDSVQPWLHDVLGFLPIFGDTPSASGVFTAGVILAIMVLPIVASISRDLFLAVPHDLEDGALALGTTRWEMVRGVILPCTRPGLAAAVILGLGRALGEAIAVTQVMGGATAINTSLFLPGDTLASRLASQFQGATSDMAIASLFYLAVILLVIGLIANVCAQLIVRRFQYSQGRV
jgi:phosphate transport system permease protein